MTGGASSAQRQEKPGPEYRRGVGILLLNGDGKIFVAERIDTPGAWQMPQGGIDDGEDTRAAAVRELAEETGVTAATILSETAGWLSYDLPASIRKKAWKGRYVGQAQKWFAMRFDGDDASIRLDGEHAEFRAWKWTEPANLVADIVAFKRPLYQTILTEFASVMDGLKR